MGFEDTFRKIKVKDTIKVATIDATTVNATTVAATNLSASSLTTDAIISGVQTLSGTGGMNIDVIHSVSLVSMVGGAGTGSLADGVTGQLKKIKLIRHDGNYVLTPTNLASGTTITFTGTGQVAELVFDGTEWQVLALNDAVALTALSGTGPTVA